MATQNSTLTQDQAKSLFDYKDGNLYWKEYKYPIKKDLVAGSLGKNSRIYVKIKQKNYLLHRVIFLYHYGFLPKILDHIDGNYLNNKIENLRKASALQNSHNRKIAINNSCGYKGVTKYRNRFMAQIQVNKVKKFLGYFKTPSEAHEAYKKEADKSFGEFSRHK
jgi:hypothetical protein